LSQPLDHRAQPLDVATIASVEPPVHDPPQGGGDVTVVDDLVGDLGENVVGIGGENALCAVPS
jgi:hypothetical protein